MKSMSKMLWSINNLGTLRNNSDMINAVKVIANKFTGELLTRCKTGWDNVNCFLVSILVQLNSWRLFRIRCNAVFVVKVSITWSFKWLINEARLDKYVIPTGSNQSTEHRSSQMTARRIFLKQHSKSWSFAVLNMFFIENRLIYRNVDV